jgi:hypothetical protein
MVRGGVQVLHHFLVDRFLANNWLNGFLAILMEFSLSDYLG